jgi:hypothetical protein
MSPPSVSFSYLLRSIILGFFFKKNLLLGFAGFFLPFFIHWFFSRISLSSFGFLRIESRASNFLSFLKNIYNVLSLFSYTLKKLGRPSTKTRASYVVRASLDQTMAHEFFMSPSREKNNMLWYLENVWYCVCTCVLSKFEFFFLLKLSAVCTFWIVLMCWCQK